MKLIGSALALATCAGIMAVPAQAGVADTKVTIDQNSGDFFGKVRSPEDPGTCAAGRKVILYKKRSPQQNPSEDKKIATDTASNLAPYEWNTGNTSLNNGKFYARATKIPDCKADNSKTIDLG